MKKRIALAALILIAVTAIAVYGTQQRPFPADQLLAAEVLEVAPDKLVTPAGVVVRQQMGIEQRARTWRLNRPGSNEDYIADAQVDMDTGLLISAYWHSPAHLGKAGGKARFSKEQCIARAQDFARQYCPYFQGGEPEDVTLREREVPQYEMTWRGDVDDNQQYRVSVKVSAITGNLRAYHMSVLPQPPKATTPVKITVEEAEQIVRQNLPSNITVKTIDVWRITTDSLYGPYGEPVYSVNVEGDFVENGLTFGYSDLHEVHATTGEFLSTEGRKPRKQITFGPTYIDKLDSAQIAKVKITGEQAQTIVKEHLPADMKNPLVFIKERTAESRFAPSGEPVYVCRIAYETADSQSNAGQAEVTWAVHATTGELLRKSATE